MKNRKTLKQAAMFIAAIALFILGYWFASLLTKPLTSEQIKACEKIACGIYEITRDEKITGQFELKINEETVTLSTIISGEKVNVSTS